MQCRETSVLPYYCVAGVVASVAFYAAMVSTLTTENPTGEAGL